METDIEEILRIMRAENFLWAYEHDLYGVVEFEGSRTMVGKETIREMLDKGLIEIDLKLSVYREEGDNLCYRIKV